MSLLERGRGLSYAGRAAGLDALANLKLTPEQTARLRRILSGTRADTGRLIVNGSLIANCLIGFVGWMAAMAAVGAVTHGSYGNLLLALAVLSVPALLAAAVGLDGWCGRTVTLAAVAALERHGGPECVDALCEAGPANIGTAQAQVRAALLAVLRRTSPDDYGRLPPACTEGLIMMINWRDPDIAEACLNALRAAGGGAVASDVERVTRSGKSAQIRQLAADVLPILLERQRNEVASSTLLRAAPASASGDLLRCAVEPEAQPEAQPEHLLRASVEE